MRSVRNLPSNWLAALALCGLVAGCAAPAAQTTRPALSPAAPAGWNADALMDAIAWAESHHSSSLIILWRGDVVVEQHWPETRGGDRLGARVVYRGLRRGTTANGEAIEDVASVQKSVVAVLAAMAAERGLLDTDAAVSDYLGSSWSQASRGEEARIRVRHLMTMTSGLDDDLRFAQDAGFHWAYVNNAFHQLHAVLEAATGKPGQELLDEWLAEPLGWSAEARFAPRPLSRLRGLTVTANDLAGFGEMVRRGGTTPDGTRLIERARLDALLVPSQRKNPAYGALWWLNGGSHSVFPRGRRVGGPLFPAAPRDLVMGLGALDRVVAVSRAHELTVVRIGGAVSGERNPGAMNGFWVHLARALPPVDPVD